MDHAVLIANPAASQFTSGVHRQAQRILRRRFDLTVAWPESAAHATQISAKAVVDGAALVVAMGGDGIVHHVAQPLVGTGVALGIIPVGTTNVVARLFDIPMRATAALKLLATNHLEIPSPVLRLVASGPEGEQVRHGVFSMGMGVDSEVVIRAEAEPYRKYTFGSIHYARTAIGTVWSDLRHKKETLTIRAGGTTVKGIGIMAQIHPVFTYFGRVPLTLDPEVPDPLSVLVVEELPMRRAAAVLWGAMRGELAGVTGMTLIRHPEVQVEAIRGPIAAQIDGEVIRAIEHATVSVVPEGLRIAAPQPSRR
jgi:diacylglycerol kinase family enzyme